MAGDRWSRDCWCRIEWLSVIAVTPAPVSETQLAEAARRQRDDLLFASDWTQVPDTLVDQQAWRSYRAVLRQVPEQTGFPHNVEWPVSPGK
ncbi:tail fiber assembly protein [Dickeya dadantii subsp. dieffenbachiae]|uniref:tail fiber assembly protein n=1 Tax=Dickeya dadantii TaxID=204038 RepID=UPI001F248D72|nr:tail fiber assembly protein [Dickeya dadantii]